MTWICHDVITKSFNITHYITHFHGTFQPLLPFSLFQFIDISITSHRILTPDITISLIPNKISQKLQGFRMVLFMFKFPVREKLQNGLFVCRYNCIGWSLKSKNPHS